MQPAPMHSLGLTANVTLTTQAMDVIVNLQIIVMQTHVQLFQHAQAERRLLHINNMKTGLYANATMDILRQGSDINYIETL